MGLLCMALCACGTPHIHKGKAKVRTYAKDTYASPDAARSPGSLWSEGAHNLFEETRGRRVGDILTVVVDEQSQAARDSGTAMQRQGDMRVGISAFLAAMQSYASTHPGFDPNALLATSMASSFAGQGSTSASGNLNATVPVRIKDVLPNGDFYIEGNKTLLLNNEESHLYLSGVVRPIDVNTDNSVGSSVLADVELEYTGRGVMAENERPGILWRALNYIWPF
jgi:flagellar L-ring protein precursor FlgH